LREAGRRCPKPGVDDPLKSLRRNRVGEVVAHHAACREDFSKFHDYILSLTTTMMSGAGWGQWPVNGLT